MPWWHELETSVRAHAAPEPSAPPRKRSGVAAILELAGDPRVLLMRRSEQERDPWSGQVSLPGGRLEPGDADLAATAVRETREEVGVNLTDAARLVGRLEAIQAVGRGVRLAMDVTPFVFVLEASIDPTPNEEAQEVFWFPLEHAVSGDLDGEHEVERHGLTYHHPCWNFDGRVIWGLTYRILRHLLRVGGAPL